MISVRMMKISAMMKEAMGTSAEHVYGASAVHTDKLSLMRLRNSANQVSDNIAKTGKALKEKSNLADDTFVSAEKALHDGKKVE